MGSQPTRFGFGEALLEAGKENERVAVVSCDLSGATRTDLFAKEFPERFFEVGIAEQNGVSVAAGLAMSGKRVFISSFGAFLTNRALDQITNSVAYSDARVVLVGTHSGLAIGKDGATQMGVADISVLSAIPNMQIFQPADFQEAKQITKYLANSDNIAYLRLSRTPHPDVFDRDYSFKFNVPTVLREGRDVSLFATGDTTYTSLEAAKKLEERGILADVISFSTLNPINADTISYYGNSRRGIVTVEDHSIIGGLGSRVCEVISESGNLHAKVLRHGIKGFGESGSPEDLYKKHKLDASGIAEVVEKFYREL